MGVESALQKTIFDTLTAALSVPVYDEVPQEDTIFASDFPYVTIGETDLSVDTTDLSDSYLALTTIIVWSRYRGRLEVKDLQAEIYTALHRVDDLVIEAPYTIFGVNFLDSQSIVETDGVTRQGLSNFEIFIDTPQGGE